MTKKLPLWFGVYGKEYPIDEPAFFEEEEFSWAEDFKKSYSEIKRELAPLMERGNPKLKPYFGDMLQIPPNNWKTTGFYFWGKKSKLNETQFPITAEALRKIPGLTTASFNLLEPQSRILPHFGETNATYRAHFCIFSPGELPECGFKVKDEERSWHQGEFLFFLDANKHEAFNLTDKPRYILLIEVVRPEFLHLKKYICIKALAILSLYYALGLIGVTKLASLEKLQLLMQKTPELFIDLLLLPLRLIWGTNLFFSKLFGTKKWII